jgi:hypothetical protein
MRAISYAAERFLTSDAVANAVLQYSMVLAKHDTSDVVPIPVVFEGKVRTADIIIGPASQITAIDVDEEPDTELDDRATLADIEERSRRLESPPNVGPEPPTPGETSVDSIDLDLD